MPKLIPDSRKRKLVAFRLPPQTVKQLGAESRRLRRSKTWILENALREWFALKRA